MAVGRKTPREVSVVVVCVIMASLGTSFTLPGESHMTITQAAITVLKKHGGPMTVEEIYQGILKEGLFEFKAKSPGSVLRTQLRRHSVNVTSKAKSGGGEFIRVDKDRFNLSK
jgi:hypothetical protein